MAPWNEEQHGFLKIKRSKDMATEATKAAQGSAKITDEIQKMEYEPLLPVEKKLIGWSVGLGVGLLAFLYWLSVTFFPSGH